MARTAKPWFNRQRECWMVWFNGQRVKLVEGKKNKKAAIVAGVNLKTTSELMGHTTTKTKMTEHYVHLAGQTAHLAAAMRLANARRQGA